MPPAQKPHATPLRKSRSDGVGSLKRPTQRREVPVIHHQGHAPTSDRSIHLLPTNSWASAPGSKWAPWLDLTADPEPLVRPGGVGAISVERALKTTTVTE